MSESSIPQYPIMDKRKVKAVFIHGSVGKEFRNLEKVKNAALVVGKNLFHSDCPLRALRAHYVRVSEFGVEGYMVLLVVDDRL